MFIKVAYLARDLGSRSYITRQFCAKAVEKKKKEKKHGYFPCLSLTDMLFLSVLGEVIFQFIKINWNCMCLHFDQIRTWRRCLKFTFFGLYIYVKCVKTVQSGWAMIEIIFYETTDHLHQFRAFAFSSAIFIGFIQLWQETLQHIERFSRPFCLLHLIDKWFLFFRFSLYLRSFPSLFIFQILNYVSKGFYWKKFC